MTGKALSFKKGGGKGRGKWKKRRKEGGGKRRTGLGRAQGLSLGKADPFPNLFVGELGEGRRKNGKQGNQRTEWISEPGDRRQGGGKECRGGMVGPRESDWGNDLPVIIYCYTALSTPFVTFGSHRFSKIIFFDKQI